MGDGTGIEWTDATLNPTTGCTKVSEGCLNCYIDRTPPFRMAGRKFDGDGGIGASTDLQLHPDRLDKMLRWTRPRRVFLNSLSDLFHKDVDTGFIARTFGAMAWAPRHTFQVLTKRPGRMRALLNDPEFVERVLHWTLHYGGNYDRPKIDRGKPFDIWPLPNVWLGVSVENQKWANVRIPQLLNTPAAVRFLSCEPLLGPVTFRWAPWVPWVGGNHLDGLKGIDWVIVGGESGPKARPIHPDWARTLRDQCVEAGVAFHFKQWGEWGPPPYRTTPIAAEDKRAWHRFESGKLVIRYGKKVAGRELDGRTWDEFPDPVEAVRV